MKLESGIHNKKYPPSPKEVLPLTLDKLQDGCTTDFDLFVKISSGLEIYASAPYSWSNAEVQRLSKNGHGVLYYCTRDAGKVTAFERVSRITHVNMALPPAQRLLAITDVGAEITRILFDFPLSQSTLKLAKNVSNNLVETVLEDRSCIKALGKLAHHDYYTYYHSARVAAYALAISMQQSLFKVDRLKDIALGCLLHDVGKSQVEAEIINKRGKLSELEWRKMKMHPVFGDELVDESILEAVPRSIILHHHERIDGKGYPYGLTRNEVFDEVRIASFADVFDALTTNRSYQASRSRFEALDFIRFNLLDGLDHEAFKALVSLLNDSREPTSVAA